MTDEIAPALTPEEWAGSCFGTLSEYGRVAIVGDSVVVTCDIDSAYITDSRERHALAALCLYEQPFGFTAEELTAVDEAEPWGGMDGCMGETEEREVARKQALLNSVVAKIRALLPPSSCPYGFTDFHVRLLETVAAEREELVHDDERAEELRHLAVKIRALLPPQDE